MSPSPLEVSFAAMAGVGAVLVGVGGTVGRGRDGPGANEYAVYLLLLGVTALAGGVYGLGAVVRPLPGVGGGLRPVWYDMVYALVVLLVIPWVLFTVRYTGRSRDLGLTARREAAFSVPVVATPLLLWGAVVAERVLGWSLSMAATTALETTVVLLGFYTFTLHFGAVAFLVYAAYVYDHLPTPQGLSLGVTAAAPLPALLIAGSILTGEATPAWVGAAAMTVGFAVCAAGAGLGVVRYDAFRTTPAAGNVGREKLIEEMDDLVLVVDAAGEVAEANPAARAALPEAPDGRAVSELLGREVEELRGVESVELATAEGHRRFDPGTARLEDRHGREFGHLVTLRDVTRREIREQRLEVLNRVLRHDLRNKLSIVKGTADTIAEGREPPDQAADRLGRAAEDLMELGEKAREIERLMREDGPEGIPVAVETVVGEVVDEVAREYPEGEFETTVPGDCYVEASEGLLRYVLENLVENAVEHNPDPEPWVGVTVEWTGEDREAVAITVADDGPGIPQQELAAIRDSEERPLVHGSGIGLWAANWCATRLGGELRFERAGEDGTTVRVELPPSAPFRAAETEREGEGEEAGTVAVELD